MTVVSFTSPEGPSPVEGRALAHVAGFEYLAPIMRTQHRKGRREHGQAIDDWRVPQQVVLTEAAAEACDLLTYLERADGVPWELMAHVREACRHLNLMLRAEGAP